MDKVKKQNIELGPNAIIIDSDAVDNKKENSHSKNINHDDSLNKIHLKNEKEKASSIDGVIIVVDESDQVHSEFPINIEKEENKNNNSKDRAGTSILI